MDVIASCAERALRHSPHPALRLSELLGVVAEEIDRTLSAARLRAVLEDHRDRFRILEPGPGLPWPQVHAGTARQPVGDAWVVSVGDPQDPPEGPAAPVLKLRESVRWLGRGVDTRSRAEVGRWCAIALEERAARDAVERKAA